MAGLKRRLGHWAVWAMAAGPAIAGCAGREPNVRLGRAVERPPAVDLKAGATAPDFVFIDGSGKPARFSAVHQRVSVVVFPNNPDEWPNPGIYRACAELAQSLSAQDIPVLIFNVGQPRRTWEEAARVLESNPVNASHLMMVADRQGDIHRLFGPHSGGKFFVIDNYHHVAEVGVFSGVESMREPVRRAVKKVLEEDAKYTALHG